MNWSEPLDLYCERTDASFWAEPVNALTNVAFLIAAAAAFVAWRRSKRDPFTLVLIGCVLLVGLGSFAFHTLATRGAVLFDVIPIALFVYGYFLFALRRFLHLGVVPALAVLAAFIVASQALSAVLPRGFLNGSGEYLAPLAALLGIGWLLKAGHERRGVLTAGMLFAGSLAFRTVDQMACAAFPLGTHFIWHLLNAVVLYLLLRTAIRTPAAHIPSYSQAMPS
jgi:Ceramidase